MMAQPGPANQAPQESQDEQHLKLLSIFHYVCAGLAGMVGCFPIFHVVIGIAIMAGGLSGRAAKGSKNAAKTRIICLTKKPLVTPATRPAVFALAAMLFAFAW